MLRQLQVSSTTALGHLTSIFNSFAPSPEPACTYIIYSCMSIGVVGRGAWAWRTNWERPEGRISDPHGRLLDAGRWRGVVGRGAWGVADKPGAARRAY